MIVSDLGELIARGLSFDSHSYQETVFPAIVITLQRNAVPENLCSPVLNRNTPKFLTLGSLHCQSTLLKGR